MYDLVFITHLPAFYKVRLYNEIAKRQKIFVIFIGRTSCIRNQDFVSHPCLFEHIFLYPGDFEFRSKWSSLVKLIRFLSKTKAKRFIVGGWELPEFWLSVLYNAKKSNALGLESSIYESKIEGLKGWIKKLFLARVAKVYASGQPHRELLRALNYQGEVAITKGVGLFDREKIEHSSDFNVKDLQNHNQSLKCLYVGRLSSGKNVQLLIHCFKDLSTASLSIVGAGPQEQELKSLCYEKVLSRNNNGNKAENNSENSSSFGVQEPAIKFLGAIPNHALAQIYQSHDIFILPSLFEPWGLVVEEALFHGMFVIVSDAVGCHRDLINPGVNGLVFEKDSQSALFSAIAKAQQILQERKIENKYLKKPGYDFVRRDLLQIDAYC